MVFPLLPSFLVSVMSSYPFPSAVVVLTWAWVSRPFSVSGQGHLRRVGSEDSDLHGRGQQPGPRGTPPEGPCQLRGEVHCKHWDVGGGQAGETLLMVPPELLRKAQEIVMLAGGGTPAWPTHPQPPTPHPTPTPPSPLPPQIPQRKQRPDCLYWT